MGYPLAHQSWDVEEADERVDHGETDGSDGVAEEWEKDRC